MKQKIKSRVKIDPATQCWIWQGALRPNGYGQINSRRAHRVSYETFNGPIPAGHVVMHKCDNPPCVNPEHLVTGTQADNMRDMRVKGRDNYLLGQEHSRAKLTEADVRAIRSDKRTRQVIADEYGVTRKAIEKIIYRERWTHI